MTYSQKIKEWAEEQGDPIRRQADELRSRGNWVEPMEAERPSVLDDAKRVINGERQDSYGNPEDSFQIIAGYWDIYVKERVKAVFRDILRDDRFKDLRDLFDNNSVVIPVDVANMMILFKQARKLGQKPCRDNYVDSIGYEAIAADRLIKWEGQKGLTSM